MLRTKCPIAGLACLALAACSDPSPLHGLEDVGQDTVERTSHGDYLVLVSGESAFLAGLEAPKPNGPFAQPPPFAQESARLLHDLASGQAVQFYSENLPKSLNSPDSLQVEIIGVDTPPLWLNREMVAQGGARVRLSIRSDSDVASSLLAAERRARREGLGLWADKTYAPKQASEVEDSFEGYLLVEGRLGRRTRAGGRPFGYPDTGGLDCYRYFEGTDLRASVFSDARSVCTLPEGTLVRLRGWKRSSLLVNVGYHVERLDEGDP